MNASFVEMNRLWGQIRAKKREIKLLRKDYDHQKKLCEHVFTDPEAESE